VVLSLKPNHPEAKKYVKRAKSQIAIEKKFTEGVSLLNQKDYEAAIKIFEEVKQQNPKYPRIDQYIGRARNALNRIAREEVQKSTEKKRRDQIDRLLRQGENLFKQNKLDEAEVKFSFVLQIASNHPRALRFLDKIKEGRRQENIIQEFRLAVQFYDQNNLDDAETKFRQVIVMSDGHHVESEEYLEKIRERKLNLNPTATISEAQRKTRAGVSAFYEGDYKKAIVQLEDVARNENNVADVYAFLACAYATKYFLQGEQDSTLYKMAIMRFRKATQLNPNYTLQDKYISPKIIGMFSEKLSRK
ncbi:MAG: tetratricopeptide repeat protein, partial [Thermodesulfobacteriota bacterium]